MKRTACIIQARLGSTRLPAKVLLPLPTGRSVLEEVIFRCRQIEGVVVVVVAIPDTSENDILLPAIKRARMAEFVEVTSVEELGLGGKALSTTRKHDGKPQVELFRGPEHDVLKRYAMAAEAVGADVIMRVTADCPLIYPDVCSKVLAHFHGDGKADYCSNVHTRSFPQGLDCEVFTRAALMAADELAPKIRREHVTDWIIGHPAFSCSNWGNPVDFSKVRWTLDTIGDYVTIWNEFQNWRHEGWDAMAQDLAFRGLDAPN